MDSLPAQVHNATVQVSEQSSAPFIVDINDATYDETTRQATITMDEAYQKSYWIEGYDGEYITLVYKGTKPDLTLCPTLSVPVDDVVRDINFIQNEVTLTISNIPKKNADIIAQTLCLLIDTQTVKTVSNPDYISPEKRKQLRKDYLLLNE
jgi:hypothetical protein